MSYAPEDRHERDVGGSSRNPGLDMEKHEKTKGLKSNIIFVFVFFLYSSAIILPLSFSCHLLYVPDFETTRNVDIFSLGVKADFTYFIVNSSCDKHLYTISVMVVIYHCFYLLIKNWRIRSSIMLMIFLSTLIS